MREVETPDPLVRLAGLIRTELAAFHGMKRIEADDSTVDAMTESLVAEIAYTVPRGSSSELELDDTGQAVRYADSLAGIE